MADNKNKDDKNKKVRSFLNVMASVADPELRKLGETLASSIPESSWLRSEGAERVIGALKGWAESQSVSMGPVVGIAVEKLTDLLDFSSEKLYGKNDKKGAFTSVSTEDWMKRFFEDAGNRMARSSDPTGEYQKLELEFELRILLMNLIEAKRKEMEPELPSTPSQPIDWNAEWEKFLRGSKIVFREAKKANRKLNRFVNNNRPTWLKDHEVARKPGFLRIFWG